MVTYWIRTYWEYPNYLELYIIGYKVTAINLEGRHTYITYGLQDIINQLNKLHYIQDGIIIVNEVEEKQLIKEIDRANKKLQIKMLQQ